MKTPPNDPMVEEASAGDNPGSPIGRGFREFVAFFRRCNSGSRSNDKEDRFSRSMSSTALSLDEPQLTIMGPDGAVHGRIPWDPLAQPCHRSTSMEAETRENIPIVAKLTAGRASRSMDFRLERFTSRETVEPRAPSPSLVTEGILTKQELAVISHSWALIAGQLKTTLDFGTIFYRHLFAIAPETASFFSQQSCVQEMAFSLMFRSLIVNLERTCFIVETLKKCAHRHVRYGVKVEHFPVVGQALVAAIIECLGGVDAMDPGVADAWIKLWGKIVEVMSDEIRRTELHGCPFCSKEAICPSSIDLGPAPSSTSIISPEPECPAKKGKLKSCLGR